MDCFFIYCYKLNLFCLWKLFNKFIITITSNVINIISILLNKFETPIIFKMKYSMFSKREPYCYRNGSRKYFYRKNRYWLNIYRYSLQPKQNNKFLCIKLWKISSFLSYNFWNNYMRLKLIIKDYNP